MQRETGWREKTLCPEFSVSLLLILLQLRKYGYYEQQLHTTVNWKANWFLNTSFGAWGQSVIFSFSSQGILILILSFLSKLCFFVIRKFQKDFLESLNIRKSQFNLFYSSLILWGVQMGWLHRYLGAHLNVVGIKMKYFYLW